MNSCSVCNELVADSSNLSDLEYAKLVNNKSTIIYSTKNFAVLPSIGALNETHVLIVPKKHYLSFSQLPSSLDDEIKNIKALFNSYTLEKIGKGLFYFEHGTGKGCNTSGACISHAHVHAISLVNEFQDSLFNHLKMEQLNMYQDLHFNADVINGYIFFEDSKKHYWIKNNPQVQSQYFRYLYVNVSNLSLNWNWRVSPNIDIVKQVLMFYKDI